MKLVKVTAMKNKVEFVCYVNMDNVEVFNAQPVGGITRVVVTKNDVTIPLIHSFSNLEDIKPIIDCDDVRGARIRVTAIARSAALAEASFLVSDILAIIPKHEEENPIKGACEILRGDGSCSYIAENETVVLTRIKLALNYMHN